MAETMDYQVSGVPKERSFFGKIFQWGGDILSGAGTGAVKGGVAGLKTGGVLTAIMLGLTAVGTIALALNPATWAIAAAAGIAILGTTASLWAGAVLTTTATLTGSSVGIGWGALMGPRNGGLQREREMMQTMGVTPETKPAALLGQKEVELSQARQELLDAARDYNSGVTPVIPPVGPAQMRLNSREASASVGESRGPTA